MSIDLSIRKNEKNTGKFYQKSPYGIDCKKTKAIALRDITKECGSNKLFTRNYVPIEYRILELSEYDFIYIPIN
jgi:hypothetical protein